MTARHDPAGDLPHHNHPLGAASPFGRPRGECPGCDYKSDHEVGWTSAPPAPPMPAAGDLPHTVTRRVDDEDGAVEVAAIVRQPVWPHTGDPITDPKLHGTGAQRTPQQAKDSPGPTTAPEPVTATQPNDPPAELLWGAATDRELVTDKAPGPTADIVERLRYHPWWAITHGGQPLRDPMYDEAADEIEHLRRYVDQLLTTLRDAPTWKDRPLAVAVELREAEGRIERLRDAALAFIRLVRIDDQEASDAYEVLRRAIEAA